MPNKRVNPEFEKLNEKYKKMTKAEKIREQISYSKNAIEKYEKKLEQAKENLKLSDAEIEKLSREDEGEKESWRIYDTTWETIVERGADKNFNYDRNEFEKSIQKGKEMLIERWKRQNSNTESYEAMIKREKKEIDKLNKKLSDLGLDKMETGGNTKSEWYIDGKEATSEDFKRIYQIEISSSSFDLNPPKVEYFGNNEQSIRAYRDYKRLTNPYDKQGNLQKSYMKAVIGKAFNENSFITFGKAFRKHIDNTFTPTFHKSKKMSWSELASYIIGDGAYYIKSESDFRNFAKDLGINVPKNENDNAGMSFENGGGISNIELVSVDYLNSIRTQPKSNWNYDLEKSIEKEGIIEPVRIGYWKDYDAVALLDGHNRLDTAIELGIDKIPAIVVNYHDNPIGKVKVYKPSIYRENPKKRVI